MVFASTFAVFATGRCWDQIQAIHRLSEAQRQDLRHARWHNRRRGRCLAPDRGGHRPDAHPAQHDRGRAGGRAGDLQDDQAFADWNGPCYMRMGTRWTSRSITDPETRFQDRQGQPPAGRRRRHRSSVAGSWSRAAWRRLRCWRSATSPPRSSTCHHQAPGRGA